MSNSIKWIDRDSMDIEIIDEDGIMKIKYIYSWSIKKIQISKFKILKSKVKCKLTN